ncbi:tRNA (cmo5U34)-methyltransferase [Hydrogenispora ethanolica]|uniref:tRNA (Cmo5U34)-methyltransferase n=1 Tax=Hydrogenispora ethanolica TaxID=1082276 RepID=A0A4R1S803_HYDET|nr:class I SAM-dependent methyltransferase [Hydrogenispora ethanolica]TCL75234.1 tRNA (cmo5U34)-methyltransferase [Hydrogenispora ethanolica]
MTTPVQEAFDRVAQDYDAQRRKLIPCFDDFYQTVVAAAETAAARPRILDIGAGTGLVSMFLMEKYPQAAFTLIDLSEKMLEVAGRRLAGRANLRYILADYLEYPFAERCDLIVSALSIHHLSDPQKCALYRKCYSLLEPGGIFVNADQVSGGSEYLEAFNKRRWRERIESSGLSRAELDACYERVKLDREATLEQQLQWLKEAGFTDTDCLYKQYHFAVMFGRKHE